MKTPKPKQWAERGPTRSRRAHTHLQGAERMLDALAACAHGVWIVVEPRLGRRALRFEWTGFAGVRPIVAQLLPVFLVGIIIFEVLTGRTAINILVWQISKVLFAEAPRSLRTRRHRLGQRHRDARLLAYQDFLAWCPTLPGH